MSPVENGPWRAALEEGCSATQRATAPPPCCGMSGCPSLRAAWRHEQQWIAQALAAHTHHSAPRRQTTASAAAGAQHFCLNLDEAPAAGGFRPDRLTEVRPQERVQRHTVEQIIPAPMLDVRRWEHGQLVSMRKRLEQSPMFSGDVDSSEQTKQGALVPVKSLQSGATSESSLGRRPGCCSKRKRAWMTRSSLTTR